MKLLAAGQVALRARIRTAALRIRRRITARLGYALGVLGGAALIVAGVAMVFVPLALILAGTAIGFVCLVAMGIGTRTTS